MITQYRGFKIDLSDTSQWAWSSGQWEWSAARDDGTKITAGSLYELRTRIDRAIDGDAPPVVASADTAAAAAAEEVELIARRIAGVLTAAPNDPADQLARRIAGLPPGDVAH